MSSKLNHDYANPTHPISSKSPNTLSPAVVAHLILTIFYVLHARDPNVDSEVSFKNNLLYWLARSIYQIDPPSPCYSHFRSSLFSALTSDPSTNKILVAQLLNFLDVNFQSIENVEQLESHFSRAKACLSEGPISLLDGMKQALDKRSFLGTQLRRNILKFNSLDISQSNRFARSCKIWRDRGLKGKAKGKAKKQGGGGEEDIEMSQTRDDGSLNDDDQSEDEEEFLEEGMSLESEEEDRNPRLKAFDLYQSSLRRGDYSSSRHYLHEFFDYSPLGSERDLHQHFLLNLAYFHYEFGSLESSHDSLLEAITLSRRNGDYECLDLCDSLLKRLIREAGRDFKSQTNGDEDVDNLEGNGIGEEEDAVETWKNLQENRNRRLKLKEKQKGKDRDKGSTSEGIGIDLIEEFIQDQNDGIIGTEDEIWKAVMDLESGKPIPSVLRSLLHTLDPAPLPPTEKNLATDLPSLPHPVPKTTVSSSFTSPSAVLARLWSNLGEREISEVQIEIARNQDDSGRWGELIRIQAECMKAWDLAESGQYDLSLALLLSHSTISNLSFSCYKIWFNQVWKVLWLKSRRRGEVSACRWVKSKSPQVEREVDGAFRLEKELKPFSLQDDTSSNLVDDERCLNKEVKGDHEFVRRNWLTLEEKLRGLLYKARKLKEAKQSPLSLSPLLKCISISSSQGFLVVHKQGLVLLADVMLEIGMAKEARELLERQMEMLLEDHNLERRGEAQWIYAKAILASGKHAVEDLHHAIAWLKRSDKDFESVSNFSSRLPVLYYLARLYHTLGDVAARDSTSEEHGKVDKILKQMKSNRIPEEAQDYKEIEDLVDLIGSMVGKGWE